MDNDLTKRFQVRLHGNPIDSLDSEPEAEAKAASYREEGWKSPVVREGCPGLERVEMDAFWTVFDLDTGAQLSEKLTPAHQDPLD